MNRAERKIRRDGDLILRKMNAYQNFGTGRPEYISKKDWESVTTKAEMKSMQVKLWRELDKIDPSRSSRVKPQNPFIR
jgi:hypothetical protein